MDHTALLGQRFLSLALNPRFHHLSPRGGSSIAEAQDRLLPTLSATETQALTRPDVTFCHQ